MGVSPLMRSKVIILHSANYHQPHPIAVDHNSKEVLIK